MITLHLKYNCVHTLEFLSPSRDGNCSELFDIVSYTWTYYNCFQFNFKTKNYTMDTLKSTRAETVPGLLYFFRFTKRALNITSQGLIGYNTNRDYNRLGYFRGLFLSELGNLISLTSQEYSNTLLPSPYITNCRRYVALQIIDVFQN